MTHVVAHLKVIGDADAAAAPSNVSNDPPLFKSQQEKYPVYNGRPANRRGPPIAIYHTAFAQLKDAFVGHLEAKNELGSRDDVESKML